MWCVFGGGVQWQGPTWCLKRMTGRRMRHDEVFVDLIQSTDHRKHFRQEMHVSSISIEPTREAPWAEVAGGGGGHGF